MDEKSKLLSKSQSLASGCCLAFVYCSPQFQPGVAYESVGYKKSACWETIYRWRQNTYFWYLSVTNNLKIKSYLVTMYIEEAFNSLDHSFLISVLKKFRFGGNFIDWIKILFYKQESCLLNCGFTAVF